MKTQTRLRERLFASDLARWLLWGGLAFVVAALAWILVDRYSSDAGKQEIADSAENANSPTTENAGIVRFAQDRWKAAGIRLAPVIDLPFTERFWRSGRLILNESRTAHLSPMVDGIVREVKVRLGDDVKAGDVLAVLDCREVGQAKLDLVKTKLAADYAKVQHGWTETVNRNAVEMVKVLASGMPALEIEKQFKDRSIGDLRQQLMTAYSRRVQAKTQYEAVKGLEVQDSVPMPSVLRIRSEYETAEASFTALCEEIRFQAGQQVRMSEQKLREAETSYAMSKAMLLMLGYSTGEVDAMDALAEGAEVSLYPIRAPFDGTVIEQHAVLAERVGPQVQMFQVADLSTLWLQADITQKELPLVRTLKGSTLNFRTREAVGSPHAAKIFYTGDVVDKSSRTVSLMGSAPNPDRLLKPGEFVEVELRNPCGNSIQIPASAVQRIGTQTFVFVHQGDDLFHRVDIRLGRASEGVFEVLEGLRADQSVAASGGFLLKSEMLKEQMAGD